MKVLGDGNAQDVVLGRNGRMPSFNVGNINAIPIGLGDLRLVNDGQTMIGTLGVRYEPTVQTARFRPYVSGGIGLNFTDQEFNFESTALSRIRRVNSRCRSWIAPAR